MPADKVQVLHTWLSMFGLRVLVALKAKGVRYEYLEQDLANKSQLLLDSNPIHKKIPVLIHNGKPVCESLIIVEYIDEAWPSSTHGVSFLPKDPYDRAVARFWADYVDKKVFDAVMRTFKNPPGEQREQGKEDFIEALKTLDGVLRDVCGGGPFFGGQSIGFVDIALAPFLCWFETYEGFGELKIWEAAKCPHLSKWAETVLAEPSVKEALSIANPQKIVEFMKQRLQD